MVGTRKGEVQIQISTKSCQWLRQGQSPRKENPMGRRTEGKTIKKDTMNCGEWAGPATKKESLGSKSPWEATPALFSVGSSTPQETHSA